MLFIWCSFSFGSGCHHPKLEGCDTQQSSRKALTPTRQEKEAKTHNGVLGDSLPSIHSNGSLVPSYSSYT